MRSPTDKPFVEPVFKWCLSLAAIFLLSCAPGGMPGAGGPEGDTGGGLLRGGGEGPGTSGGGAGGPLIQGGGAGPSVQGPGGGSSATGGGSSAAGSDPATGGLIPGSPSPQPGGTSLLPVFSGGDVTDLGPSGGAAEGGSSEDGDDEEEWYFADGGMASGDVTGETPLPEPNPATAQLSLGPCGGTLAYSEGPFASPTGETNEKGHREIVVWGQVKTHVETRVESWGTILGGDYPVSNGRVRVAKRSAGSRRGHVVIGRDKTSGDGRFCTHVYVTPEVERLRVLTRRQFAWSIWCDEPWLKGSPRITEREDLPSCQQILQIPIPRYYPDLEIRPIPDEKALDQNNEKALDQNNEKASEFRKIVIPPSGIIFKNR